MDVASDKKNGFCMATLVDKHNIQKEIKVKMYANKYFEGLCAVPVALIHTQPHPCGQLNNCGRLCFVSGVSRSRQMPQLLAFRTEPIGVFMLL